MNDPTAAERDALGARLTGSIPTEPDLAGLAARAESGARRTRRVRRIGVAVVAAVAVATVIAVPQLVGSQPVPAGGPPAPARVPAHPCSGRPDHADFRTGTPAWVTFCPSTPSGTNRLALHPPGVLTAGAAELVDGWRTHLLEYEIEPNCGIETGQAFVRVGFADGTVSEIDVQCVGLISGGILGVAGSVYDDLVRALGREAASGHPNYNPPGPPRRCPRSLAAPGRMNLDGASAPELANSRMILDMTAVEGLVCRYGGSGTLTGSGPAANPEDLRIATGSSVWDRFVQLGPDPATSYLVTLRDSTDTWRTFTITGRKHQLTFFRGAAPGVPERIGYAEEHLVQMAQHATR